MSLKYIVHVNTNTGEILNVLVPGGVIREDQQEGAIENSDPPTEIFHLYTEDIEGLDTMQAGVFMQNYYRQDNTWAYRGPPPTDHYTWDTVNSVWIFNSETFWVIARLTRNQKLGECDWTQLRDAILTTDQRLAWQNYRNELRDIPERYSGVTNLDDITWPTPPE